MMSGENADRMDTKRNPTKTGDLMKEDRWTATRIDSSSERVYSEKENKRGSDRM